MLKSTSTSLILRGVLAIIVGIIALAWPDVTILALRSSGTCCSVCLTWRPG